MSAADVLLLLHQEADKTGNDRYRVTGIALRKWVFRGHITRGDGGYDLQEILRYLEHRFPVETGNGKPLPRMPTSAED